MKKLSIIFLLSLFAIGLSTVSAQELRRKEGRHGKWGYVYRGTSKLAIPMKFDYACPFYGKELAMVRVGGKLRKGNYMGKFGFIDKTGAAVVPIIYDGVALFADGMATVNIGGQWVKKRGKAVFSGGKCGFIDTTGKLVVPLVYDDCEDFEDGYAPASLGGEWIDYKYVNGKWGVIDKTGAVVVPIEYDSKEQALEALENEIVVGVELK